MIRITLTIVIIHTNSPIVNTPFDKELETTTTVGEIRLHTDSEGLIGKP